MLENHWHFLPVIELSQQYLSKQSAILKCIGKDEEENKTENKQVGVGASTATRLS